jgi:hypothetical protein
MLHAMDRESSQKVYSSLTSPNPFCLSLTTRETYFCEIVSKADEYRPTHDERQAYSCQTGVRLRAVLTCSDVDNEVDGLVTHFAKHCNTKLDTSIGHLRFH